MNTTQATSMMTAQLAALIDNAARIREESYDTAKAEQTVANEIIGVTLDTRHLIAAEQFYTKTLQQACAEACEAANEPQMADLVYYLLKFTWNESLDWAKENN